MYGRISNILDVQSQYKFSEMQSDLILWPIRNKILPLSDFSCLSFLVIFNYDSFADLGIRFHLIEVIPCCDCHTPLISPFMMASSDHDADLLLTVPVCG